MIDLNTERMSGRGDVVINGMKANKLFGLNDLCKKYVTKSTNILELGCHNCVSTRLFCHYSDNVTAVDNYQSPYVNSTIKEHIGFNFVKSKFQDFFNKCDKRFDLIYIDGDHKYNSVKNDIISSLKIIKPGGILSGHDYYTSTNSDVPRVIEEILYKYDKPEVFSDSSWLVHIPL